MSITNFIPQIWAATYLDNLSAAHVYANCVNRDFEGEIKSFGDTVRINNIGRVTISSYTKGSTNLTPEALDGAGQTLNISQSKFFFFAIDDVDKAQAKPKVMEAAMKEAAWGMADTQDVYLSATVIANGVPAANTLVSTSVGTGAGDTGAFETLAQLRNVLQTNNAPPNDRWVVIPPWMEMMLLLDPRFSSFGTAANLALAMNGAGTEPGNTTGALGGSLGGSEGPLAKMLGMTVYVSNNVPVSAGAYTVLAGFKGAVTFAESIAEGQPEAFRLQTGFQDAVRGLMVYGGTVTRPAALASIVVTQGDAA